MPAHPCCEYTPRFRGGTLSKHSHLKEVFFFCFILGLTVSASFSELDEFLQALKWTQHCLTDAQSQEDVELIMKLLAKEDFRNAYTVYSAVSQQKSRVSPTSPLTVQAEDLCQEVTTAFTLKGLVKAENRALTLLLH